MDCHGLLWFVTAFDSSHFDGGGSADKVVSIQLV
jgi:hypothetical protein